MAALRQTFVSLLFLLLSISALRAQTGPAFLQTPTAWADSVFSTLSPDERISQLIMVAGYSNRTRSYEDSLTALVRQYRLGGVIFFQGGPLRQAKLTNRLQAASAVPMLVAMDAEWGLGMRLDSTVRYPYQMTLGAMPAGLASETLIYRMGADLARQARRLGVHVNFAPSVDVNNNPNNPVINFRSFGEDREQVYRRARAYMLGMQDNRLLTSLKHFPGHGDTGTDSHFDLPVIVKSRAQLDSLELYPFRRLIAEGASGVMIAHLSIPALDTTKNRPSTLSPGIITGLLKNELGFRGLVFSDAMNMKGLLKYYAPGMADQLSFEAGMDVLEFPNNVEKAVAETRRAVAEGRISQQSIDERCRRVLLAKAWVGLDRFRRVTLDGLTADLNQPESEVLNRQLVAQSLTLLRNEQNLIPLRALDTLRIASVSVEAERLTPFQQMAGNYTQVDHFTLNSRTPDSTVARTLETLENYNLVLVGVHPAGIRPAANYGFAAKTGALVEALTASGRAVVTLFGNAYALAKLPGLERARAVLLAYQPGTLPEELSAQALFGAAPLVGKLPVTINEQFRFGAGQVTESLDRLAYTIPEAVGIDSKFLTRQVDSLVNVGLQQRAFPGCVVQMAKDGKVIFRKAYGAHTYETKLTANASGNVVAGVRFEDQMDVFRNSPAGPANSRNRTAPITTESDLNRPTRPDDLFDLASITKISTSTPALMRLVDEGKFDVNGTMGQYLPRYRKSNKDTLVWRDVLTHQSKLKAWIPFWKDAVNTDGTFKPRTFQTVRSRRYSVEVADSLFLHRSYSHIVFDQIRDSPLNEQKEYVYSDLSFYLYPQIVQKLTGDDFETYLKKTFYGPLGASTLTYNPRRFYPLSRIVPTERDSLFRKTLIWGRVHDEGAAMLNGLSGHAGLFGSANDLMKLMQMYLQQGRYGGTRFLSPAVLTEFSRYQFPELGNRRGLAFEKPSYRFSGNAPRSASASSFGHSGFTGTFTWIDPAYNLTYVFLSNRVYPTRNNNKISELNTRTNVAEVLYQAIRRGRGTTTL
jgi:beta-N-acetylhexosaminidase